MDGCKDQWNAVYSGSGFQVPCRVPIPVPFPRFQVLRFLSMNKSLCRTGVRRPDLQVVLVPGPFARSLFGLRGMRYLKSRGAARQEVAKLFDRVTTADRPVDPATILRQHAPAYVNPGAALEILRTVAPTRFFAGVEHLSFAAQAVPEHRVAVLTSATENVQNRFDLLGYRTLWFGDPIDWHLGPGVGAARAPGHWTQLHPLDAAESATANRLGVESAQVVARLRARVCIHRRRAIRRNSASRHRVVWIDANPHGIGVTVEQSRGWRTD